MNKRRPLLLTLLFLALLCGYAAWALLAPIDHSRAPVMVEIERGASFRDAVGELNRAGLLRDERLFMLAGKIGDLEGRIIPGLYVFQGEIDARGVYAALSEGRIVRDRVTVVEGDPLSEVAEKLEEAGLMERKVFDSLARDRQVALSMGVEADTLEGYLFPDTYFFPRGMEPQEVLEVMVERFWKAYTPKLRERTAEIGMSVHEVVTLASIIEKEAVLDKERPIISAVYHNRLKRGMRLQADPTSIYGRKPYGAGVSATDVRTPSPYNTYFIKGLPPGPIASPGLSSIEAALWPADVPYLYFVARRDGSHVFSLSSREHNRAIRSIHGRKQ